MKFIKLLSVLFSVFFCMSGFAEEDIPPSLVTPIKEVRIEDLILENIPKESFVGDLSQLVETPMSNLAASLTDQIRSNHILTPYAEGLAYVNGTLCHVGNYKRSTIYTVLEGPYYGLQTTMSLSGEILYVNHEYRLKNTSNGVILQHKYRDSKVITGSTQVIIFK